jgi:hypothetical protein
MKSRKNIFVKILAISILTISILVGAKLLADELTIKPEINWTVPLLITLQIVLLVITTIANLSRFLSKDRLKNTSSAENHTRGYRFERYLLQQWQRSEGGEAEMFVPIQDEDTIMELDERTRKIIRAIQKWDGRKRYFNTMTLDEFLGSYFGFVGGKPAMPQSTFYNYREKYYKFLNKDETNQDSKNLTK